MTAVLPTACIKVNSIKVNMHSCVSEAAAFLTSCYSFEDVRFCSILLSRVLADTSSLSYNTTCSTACAVHAV